MGKKIRMGVWGKVRVLWRKDGSVGKGKRAREKERKTLRKVRREGKERKGESGECREKNLFNRKG